MDLHNFKTSISNIINLSKYDDDGDIISIRHIISTLTDINNNSTRECKPLRQKTSILPSEQCVAKKSSGCQCTRRRKNTESYCGTHLKGRPHGDFSSSPEMESDTRRYTTSVWIQIIDEITYYIDDNNNIYNPEDIIYNKINPKVIAKYDVDESGIYSIRSFINPT